MSTYTQNQPILGTFYVGHQIKSVIKSLKSSKIGNNKLSDTPFEQQTQGITPYTFPPKDHNREKSSWYLTSVKASYK